MDFFNILGEGQSGRGRGMTSFPWYDPRGAEDIVGLSPFHGHPSMTRSEQRTEQPSRSNAQVPVRPQSAHPPPSKQPQDKGKVRKIIVEDGESKKKPSPPPTPSPPTSTPPPTPPKPLPKPNRFVRPEDAAVKIQSAFLGYMIRRTKPIVHLRTISYVMKELESYKKQVLDRERVTTLREHVKERLCFMEGLMQLQIKLDGIQGVLPFVRECRKSVNRDLSRFQEEVDVLLKGEQPHLVAVDVKDESDTDMKDVQDETVEVETPGDETELVASGETELVAPKIGTEMIVDQEQEVKNPDGVSMEFDVKAVSEDEVSPSADSEIQAVIKQVEPEDEMTGPPQEEVGEAEASDCEETDEDEVVEKGVLVEDSRCGLKQESSSQAETGDELSVEKLVRKLMDENAQLRALVSECLRQTAVQNDVMFQLSKRVQKLERKRKRSCKKKDSALELE